MTTNTQIATVDFHGHALTVITGPAGEHLVAMKPIVEAIGLQWEAQLKRIKRHPVMSQGVFIMNTPSNGGDQQTTCLPLDMLNGWLFGVDASRVRPQIRDTLIQYQRECYAALAAYWQQGEAINPRKRQPKALPNLSPDQRDAIKGLVKARVEALPQNKQAKAAVTCWSALKSKFGCTYKEIESAQFAEALSLVARLPLEGELVEGQQQAITQGQHTLTDSQMYEVYVTAFHFAQLHRIFRESRLYDHLTGLGSRIGIDMVDHFTDGGATAAGLLRRHAAEFESIQRRLRVNAYR